MRRRVQRRHARLGAAVLGVALAACGRRMVEPIAFADSAAFRGIAATALGFLEHDFNADGVPDVVVVQRVGPGLAPSIYVQVATERGAAFEHVCVGPVLEGEDLDTLRWVRLGDRELLLVVASTETPDTVQHWLALLPAADPCAAVFLERVAAEKPPGEVIAPEGLRGGVLVDEDGAVLLVDQPRSVGLQAEGQAVDVLTAVRVRRLADTGSEITAEPRDLALVAPVPATVAWLRDGKPDAEAFDAPELADGNASTQLYLFAGETGTFTVAAQRPIRLLEVTQGCTDAAAHLGPVQHRTDGRSVDWAPLPAAGRRPAGSESFRRHVLLLAEPTTSVSLRFATEEAPFCLREVAAFSHGR